MVALRNSERLVTAGCELSALDSWVDPQRPVLMTKTPDSSSSETSALERRNMGGSSSLAHLRFL
jgi:hypothetical protein